MRIQRLDESNADHYIEFLEKHGIQVNSRAQSLLPKDAKVPNVAGDADGIPAIHNNMISLSGLFGKEG